MPIEPPRAVRSVAGLACAALLATGFGFALYELPPTSVTLVFVGGLLFVGTLALALTRYDVAVAFGFVIFGVVKVEPAPPDLVLICIIFIALVTGRFNIDRIPMAVLSTVGVFISLNLLTMIQAVNPQQAVFFLSITLYVAVFSLWLSTYVNSTRRAHLILSAYLIAATISTLLGLGALFGVIPGQDIFVFSGDRARALFKDPNVFGPFLVPAILMLLEDLLNPRLLRIGRAFGYLVLVTLVLGVIFSFSRAAWLNLGVGMVVLLAVMTLTRGGSQQAARLIAILVIAGAASLITLSATGYAGFLDERASVQSYDTERFGAQKFGVEYAEQHPLGAGPGQFDELSPVSAHSIYIRALTELGVLGLASLIAIALVTLVLAGRNAALGRSTYGIGSAALLASWCGVLANSAFVDTLHWRHLWMVAGLIWAGSMRRPELEPPPTEAVSLNPTAEAVGRSPVSS